MTETPPPKVHEDFVARFPRLGAAWKEINAAGSRGPLDERTQRLVKLGVAVGALREGAVHASVRKALALGIQREALEQIVALSAGTIGLPAAVAVYTWIADILDHPA